MIFDIWTIITKELREFISASGSRRGGLIGLLIILAVSVYLPLQIGADWLRLPVVIVVFGVYIPMSMVSSVVADSFAGERERHTLETLLSTRLSDRAILFGKLGAVVIYSWGIGILGAIIGAITVDIVHPNPTHFYSVAFSVATLAAGLLISLLFAGIGIIASLRAASVRQAQQVLGYIFLALFIVPLIVAPLLPPPLRDAVVTAITTANWTALGLMLGGVVLILDLILLGIARALFQRTRLIIG